jgi:Proliferating cell nuclear antigen, N-terminal domain
MFEARLVASGTLKKVLDSIKDLLNEATFDCSDSGIQVCIYFWLNLREFKNELISLKKISYKPWTTLTYLSSRSTSDQMDSISTDAIGTCRWA